MSSLQNLYSFIKDTKERSNGIVVDEENTEILEKLIKGDRKKFENQNKQRETEYKENYDITLTNEQLDQYYLSSTSLKWRRPEQASGEGYLSGGFSFNGFTTLFKFQQEFWKASVSLFDQTGEDKYIDYDLLAKLRWIESPTPLIFRENTPQFGCVKLEKGKFPDEFFFYDSGLVYPLPIASLDEYINRLIASASVRSWQYFYVDPEIIISRNKGLRYITWSLHTSSKSEPGIDKIQYNANIKADRLDLINEYLERCVRLLPESFPFIDFTHHQTYYENFKQLYYNSKK
jgi:hypothetical protein